LRAREGKERRSEVEEMEVEEEERAHLEGGTQLRIAGRDSTVRALPLAATDDDEEEGRERSGLRLKIGV